MLLKQYFYSSLTTLVAFIWIITLSCNRQSGEELKWVGTWSASQQLTEPRNMPPEPGLNGNTIRQVVHTSVGGDTLRLRISNEFGEGPVRIDQVYLAVSQGLSLIDTTSIKTVTFSGNNSATIEAGKALVSDDLVFDLDPLSDVTITMHVDSVGNALTGHPGSRTTSFIVKGKAGMQKEFPDAITTNHWYLIDAIHVKAPENFAAVATLGNSITDGRGSGINKQNRWPDVLSGRLQNNEKTKHVAVLNEGIGGNCVIKDCLGPAAVKRFERDVLSQPAIKWVIIFEGINDIGGIRNETEAEQVVSGLITAYEQLIREANQNGIKVYGATLLPFGGSFYDSPVRERARQQVNDWIRNSGKFDAVIDLDKALSDPENPTRLLPEADTGDHLHPNEEGYRLIAEAVDLSLFL